MSEVFKFCIETSHDALTRRNVDILARRAVLQTPASITSLALHTLCRRASKKYLHVGEFKYLLLSLHKSSVHQS